MARALQIAWREEPELDMVWARHDTSLLAAVVLIVSFSTCAESQMVSGLAKNHSPERDTITTAERMTKVRFAGLILPSPAGTLSSRSAVRARAPNL